MTTTTYAKADCAVCGNSIAATGWRREMIDVTRDPRYTGRFEREYIGGMIDFEGWMHTTVTPVAEHDATPMFGTIALTDAGRALIEKV